MSRPSNFPRFVHLVATRSKAWFCGLWLAGIAGSNPAAVMSVADEFSVLRCVDPSSREVLPCVVWLSVIAESQQSGDLGPLRRTSHEKKKFEAVQIIRLLVM